MPLLDELRSQLFTRPPYPTADFSGKTIIVTGTNVGLGKEAVKHFVRLNAEKVIIAVRSISKGEAAKAEIEGESKHATDIEVWKLDYASYASCKEFVANVAKLNRVDAGIHVMLLPVLIFLQLTDKFCYSDSKRWYCYRAIPVV